MNGKNHMKLILETLINRVSGHYLCQMIGERDFRYWNKKTRIRNKNCSMSGGM